MPIIKLAIEKVKKICQDLEYEWFIYTSLRKFSRLNKKSEKLKSMGVVDK